MQTVPNSRFVGYDLSEEAVAMATAEAARRGLSDVRFEVRDLAGLDHAAAFDLVTAFDVIHDQAKPAEVLANVRRALRPGGLFLMQDISCAGHHHADRARIERHQDLRHGGQHEDAERVDQRVPEVVVLEQGPVVVQAHPGPVAEQAPVVQRDPQGEHHREQPEGREHDEER